MTLDLGSFFGDERLRKQHLENSERIAKIIAIGKPLTVKIAVLFLSPNAINYRFYNIAFR